MTNFHVSTITYSSNIGEPRLSVTLVFQRFNVELVPHVKAQSFERFTNAQPTFISEFSYPKQHLGTSVEILHLL